MFQVVIFGWSLLVYRYYVYDLLVLRFDRYGHGRAHIQIHRIQRVNKFSFQNSTSMKYVYPSDKFPIFFYHKTNMYVKSTSYKIFPEKIL